MGYFKKCSRMMVAAVLAIAITALVPMTPLYQYEVKAASSKKKYLKEIKIFMTGKGANEAQAWCDKQNKDGKSNWEVFENNIVGTGYESLMVGTGKYAYLCYQSTNDYKEAITDLAVMNEHGNYSEGAYEMLIKDQREMYVDMVNDFKDMLSEYRTNYGNNVPTAVEAHDMLNGYIEDDSGKLFGDFLYEANDDDLVDVFLQSNGQVIMFMENQLAAACDTRNNTWLDRMQTLGSYQNLRKKALKSCNNSAAKADRLLKANYHEKALMLSENWDDIGIHFKNISEYEQKNGLDHMSDLQMIKWYKDHNDDPELMTYEIETSTLGLLNAYNYEDGTLYDFFSQPYEDVSGDNLYKLYPLAACLTIGQKAAAEQEVSLFNLIQSAAGATVKNGYDTEEAKEVAEAIASAEAGEASEENPGLKEIIEENKEIEDMIDEWQEAEPISIYEGVDREVFEDGGVAVTSTAVNYSNGSYKKWSDNFVDTGKIWWTFGGLAVGAIGAAIVSRLMRNAVKNAQEDMMSHVVDASLVKNPYGLEKTTLNICQTNNDIDIIWKKSSTVYSFSDDAAAYRNAINDIYEKGMAHGGDDVAKIIKFNRLKIGFAIFAVLLAIADIVVTVIALVDYYKRDHIPIPHHMVDLSYNENNETSYISYKAARDQSGKIADLYDGGGKQWLALYWTNDPDAGNPIYAPDKGKNVFKTQSGSSFVPSGYSPLHIFGKKNAAQNLTYADTDNGWTYNDEDGGNYFFFVRDDNPVSIEAATSLSAGKIALFTGIGAVAGFVLAFIILFVYNKKRKMES